MRRTLPVAATLTAALLLTGCGGDDEPEATVQPDGGDFPVTVGDLTLEAQPSRIVSLSPTVTEMLYAIDAGEQVVAADEFSTYPPEAPTTDLSGFDLNPEAVASYDPDLVVISSFADSIVPQLAELDIPVHVAPDDPATIEDVYAQLVDLGALTGHGDRAADLVDRMSEDISKLTADVPERAEPLRYYIEIDGNLWTYSSDSLVGSLFAQLGLENIADEADAVTTQLSAEALVDANPEIIFLTNAGQGVDAAAVGERDGWSAIDAVDNGRIVELDADIASRWGPRIVDLLATVADAVNQVP